MLGNTVKMLIWPPALLTRNCWLLVKSIMKVIGFCGAAADWWNVMKTDWWKVWWSANPRPGWVKLGPGLGVITGNVLYQVLDLCHPQYDGNFLPTSTTSTTLWEETVQIYFYTDQLPWCWTGEGMMKCRLCEGGEECHEDSITAALHVTPVTRGMQGPGMRWVGNYCVFVHLVVRSNYGYQQYQHIRRFNSW